MYFFRRGYLNVPIDSAYPRINAITLLKLPHDGTYSFDKIKKNVNNPRYDSYNELFVMAHYSYKVFLPIPDSIGEKTQRNLSPDLI